MISKKGWRYRSITGMGCFGHAKRGCFPAGETGDGSIGDEEAAASKPSAPRGRGGVLVRIGRAAASVAIGPV